MNEPVHRHRNGPANQGNVHEVTQEASHPRQPRHLRGQPPDGPGPCPRAAGFRAGKGGTAYVHANLRDPARIVADPRVRDVPDFGARLCAQQLANFVECCPPPGISLGPPSFPLLPGSPRQVTERMIQVHRAVNGVYYALSA
jgi:hypothetical protein